MAMKRILAVILAAIMVVGGIGSIGAEELFWDGEIAETEEMEKEDETWKRKNCL